MIKAVVFDADHTLYVPVTERAYQEKFAYLAEETGLPAEDIKMKWTRF